jgi:hypothetical protein
MKTNEEHSPEKPVAFEDRVDQLAKAVERLAEAVDKFVQAEETRT